MKIIYKLFSQTRCIIRNTSPRYKILNTARNYSTTDLCQLNSFTSRSHSCGELSKSNIGQRVRLKGWLQYQRMGYFFTLRDSYGNTQVTLELVENAEAYKDLAIESVLEVEGTVKARPEGQENKNMTTGDIEIIADKINILNTCRPDMPFQIQKYHKVKEPLRIEYRYIDLRNTKMQQNLRLRSNMVMKMREFLCNKHGFVDVETPTLFRKTPGGAREFIVPTKIEGKFYALPQSPQQFKQMLMVGGIDRYMQIARCYRDEGGRSDRQPEFTQQNKESLGSNIKYKYEEKYRTMFIIKVDIELSFVDQEDIKRLIEQLLVYCWPEGKGHMTAPFTHMTYDEAMAQYGTDKPDLRLDQILDVTDILKTTEFQPIKSKITDTDGNVKAVKIKGIATQLSKKEIDVLKQKIKEITDVNQTWFTLVKVKDDGTLAGSLQSKLVTDTTALKQVVGYEASDVLLLSAGIGYSAAETVGKARDFTVKLLTDKGINVRGDKEDDFQFLWVEDFPLFLPKVDGSGLESAHHPFTAPHVEDQHLVYEQPTKVRSQHYDLVLNGQEIGGGSIRIHNSTLQRYILQDVLKEDTSQLEHLLEALDSGCPPHGGIALGLDRLMAIICKAESIRDVIAFPKLKDGHDPMSKAPAEIGPEDRQCYHLNTKQ